MRSHTKLAPINEKCVRDLFDLIDMSNRSRNTFYPSIVLFDMIYFSLLILNFSTYNARGILREGTNLAHSISFSLALTKLCFALIFLSAATPFPPVL